jgi:hypothetical protein
MAKLTVAVAVVDLLFVLSPHVQVDIVTKFTVAVVALVLLRGGKGATIHGLGPIVKIARGSFSVRLQ